MPDQTVEQLTQPKKRSKVKWSLSLTVVLGLVLFISIPVSLMGFASYLRSRQLLLEQASTQIALAAQNQSGEVNLIARDCQAYFLKLVDEPATIQVIRDLLKDPESETSRFLSGFQLGNFIRKTPLFGTKGADQLLILDPSGKIIGSTNPQWIGANIKSYPRLVPLLGKSNLTTVYNLTEWYPDQTAIFSSRAIENNRSEVIGTLILSTTITPLAQILTSSSAGFQNSHAHFITREGISIGLDPDNPGMLVKLSHQDENQFIQNIFATSTEEGATEYETDDLGAVIAYAKWFRPLNLGLVLEVPKSIILRQVNTLIPFTILLILISLVLGAFIAFLGSLSVTRPLVKLANTASRFANGDLSERSSVKRSDEIGLLADSFNHMVEQISDLYRSMEQRVDQRSQQIRIASEIGQIATSSANREEIVQKVADLVIERFGYSYASISLMEETGMNLVIVAVESTYKNNNPEIGTRIRADSDSIIGWVARNNKPRMIIDSNMEHPFSVNLLRQNSRSQIALPIAIGTRIYGVFEVQSSNPEGFDPETISVLQTLCNQVANSLQNMLLLEATQINLEETTLLYRASRRLSATQSELELTKALTDSLGSVPHVTAIFKLMEDHVELQSLVDPRNPQSTASLQNIKLPLRNLPSLLSTSSMIILDDLSRNQDFDNLLSFFLRRDCKTAALFPIQCNGKLSKLIVVGSRDSLSLTETSLQPYANLFEVYATSLEQQRIHAEFTARIADLQTITSVGHAVSSEMDIFQLYHLLHQQVIQIMGADVSFLIANYAPADNLIHFPYVYEKGELLSVNPMPIGEGLTSYLIKTQKPLMIVKDTERQTQLLGSRVVGKMAKSWLGVPLILGGEVLGAIIIQDADNENRFTESDLALINAMAPQIATAIRNATLLTKMQQAVHDYDQDRFLFDSLLKNIPDQVFFKDGSGRYLRVSQSYADSLGIPSTAQFAQQTDDQFLDESEVTQAKDDLETVLTTQQSIHRIQLLEKGDGKTWQSISRIPLLNQENLHAGILGINRDITEIKQSEETANHRSEEMNKAQKILSEISIYLDMDEIARSAARLIEEQFNFSHVSITLNDRFKNAEKLKDSPSIADEETIPSPQSRGNANAFNVVATEPTVINDITTITFEGVSPFLPETQSALVLPLKSGQWVMGELTIQSLEKNAFPEEDVQLFNDLAMQISTHLFKVMQYALTQDYLSQHQLLHQISSTAASSSDVYELLYSSVLFLYDLRKDDRIAVYLKTSPEQLELFSEAGFEKPHFAAQWINADEGIIGKALAGKQIVIDQSDKTSATGTPNQIESQSSLAVPIIYSNQLIGVIYSESAKPSAYADNDRDIFSSLANIFGSAISNSRLMKSTQQQAEQQRRILEVTNRIRQSLDIKTIMEVSAAEIAKAVNARSARINL